jgi:N4-gp56 family major capsid protein
MNDMILMDRFSLALFNNLNTQVTTQASLSDEMKTYYSDYLIDNATPNLVHDQWAQKHPIPKNGGKVIEFRRYAPLAKALTPIVEGVTPDGNSLSVSVLTAQIKQYGDYITLSDILQLTAIDNNLVQASKLLGNQAGETLDTITREVLNSGTNVQYANGQVVSRHLLVGGDATPANNHYLSVDAIRLSVRNLKNKKAKKIDKHYVGIIHPDISYDLTGDSKWEDWHKYTTSENLYEGEIGRIHGVRFVETTEAKIFAAADLLPAARTITVTSVAGKVFTVPSMTGHAGLVGRLIIVKGFVYTVASTTATTITVVENVAGSPGSGDIIYPGEAGAKGRAVYSTVILGADAYGTTELAGGGLEFIVKQLGSGGTADPLNQRSTTGWKATKVSMLLVDEYALRVETASTFDEAAN